MSELLGKRLLELREEKQLTVLNVAEYLNVDEAEYQKYENGSLIPSDEKIKELAKFFEVTSYYLNGISNFKTIEDRKAASRDITDVEKQLMVLLDTINDKSLLLTAFRKNITPVTREKLKNTIEEMLEMIRND